MHGEVIETAQLTPSMVRVVLGGPGLDGFAPTPHTDQYVNALFVPDGAPYEVPFDLEAAKAGPPEHRPRGRRYTVRRWDAEARMLTIDFVVHGDVGHAGRWASRAKPGDRLQLTGPNGGYAPDPAADWHLMVGDESAIPAIAASLERVRPGIPVVAVLVVDGPRCQLPLASPGDLTTRWVHRTYTSDDLHQVLDAVAGASLPAGRADLFVHGEAGEVRAVRKLLLGKLGIGGPDSSISPYWRRGDTDEAWRQRKREWLAEMQADIQLP